MKKLRGKEEWKDIEGYKGLYQVSSLGRFASEEEANQAVINYRKELSWAEKEIC